MTKVAAPSRSGSSNGNTVTALSGRVTKLENSMELLTVRVGDLSQDIAASDRKQDAFHQEWRDQKEAERRQRDQERRDQENFQRSRATTPRDVVVMMAAVVTTLTAFVAVASYTLDSKIITSIQPIASRQEALAQSTLDIRDQLDKLSVRIGEIVSKADLASSRAEANFKLVQDHELRMRIIENEIARQDERLKAFISTLSTSSPRRRAPNLSSP
jgi:hypothetical protein